ncbi:DUF262 domain-containing protein [Pseudomonas syringae]|jgi:hypothetical protein|uniref:DUF262 domain-containing protein n=1 Tax=Pseudomonas syringae TaxID=317 RepID=UPI003F86DB94
MSTQSLEQFFTGKNLFIPAYQRDYAWTRPNVDDLFEDIEEAMELGGGHYLGTFILCQPHKKGPVNVVDGQQRLTTLTLLLNALISEVKDEDIRKFYHSTYISHPVHGAKFVVQGENLEYFQHLLKNDPLPAHSDGQKRLFEADQWIRRRVGALAARGGDALLREWLVNIGMLEVLEFTESNEGKAIRMFQAVNDRGVPLAKMDIAKSLLIYYSNRFLEGELDTMIAEQFGHAFRCFSKLKSLSAQSGYQIRVINREPFREDDIFRYHYLAFDGQPFGALEGLDYNASSETVLEHFLKPSLKQMRSHPSRLRDFICAYVIDLASFFKGLSDLVEEARHRRDLYTLFVIQDVSTTLYPLLIRLKLQHRLDEKVSSYGDKSLLELIEISDLRVYKIQGTNPQAGVAHLVRGLGKWDAIEIADGLMNICQRFMPSEKFRSRLNEDMYSNAGTLRILLAVEEGFRKSPYSIEDLASLVRDGITIEHIIPQSPSFGIKAYGFHSEASYDENVHRIGNLLLLETKVNSACSNNSVEAKISTHTLYGRSGFQSVLALAAEHAGKTPAYSRTAILDRSAGIANFAVDYWPVTMTTNE